MPKGDGLYAKSIAIAGEPALAAQRGVLEPAFLGVPARRLL
jgi:hypothetical protein